MLLTKQGEQKEKERERERETGPLYEYYKQVFSMSIAFQAVTTQETQEKEQEDEHTKGREKRHKKQKVIRVVVTGIRASGGSRTECYKCRKVYKQNFLVVRNEEVFQKSSDLREGREGRQTEQVTQFVN